MHVRASEHMRRGVVALLALTVLLAVVAIASSGHVPAGGGAVRRPWEELIDAFVSLVLVVVLVGSVGILYVYYLQRTAAHEDRRHGRVGGSRRSLVTIAVVTAILLAVITRFAIESRHHHSQGGAGGGNGTGAPAGDAANNRYEPRFATVPVIVILGLIAVVGVAVYVSQRSRQGALRPLDTPESLALALARVLDETLDDLRAEPDPRRAVIAAYARLERTLAAFGMPRRDSEAPDEYLQRILVDLEVGARDAARLTALFEQAKFSTHDVAPAMKREAIELLESIRADLRAVETARELASPHEAPAGLAT